MRSTDGGSASTISSCASAALVPLQPLQLLAESEANDMGIDHGLETLLERLVGILDLEVENVLHRAHIQ